MSFVSAAMSRQPLGGRLRESSGNFKLYTLFILEI